MAEKRIYDDSNEENENSILVKRPKTGMVDDPPGTSIDYRHLSGDEDRLLDSGNYKDPLSDLTKDQRVVLYTLFMSCDRHGYIYMDDDVSMGDIDVKKTVEELVDRELVRRYNNKMYISFAKQDQVMRSYRKNCLLSDIDKDFYIQVASDESLNTYAKVYIRDCDNSRESEDTGPITLMRLIVEGRAQELDYYVIQVGKVRILPPCEKNDREEFRMFVKDWCKVRDIDPMALSDGISNERTKNFYSAFTILSGLKDGLGVWHFPNRKWSILIPILLSKSYSICVGKLWKVRRREIQQTFPTLHDSKGGTTEDVSVSMQELLDFDNLLISDTENKTVHFVSEDVRHQVMGYFVLNSLKTTMDYENYINVSSVDSLWEYVRPSRYTRKINERCLYLPGRMDKSFIMRLGVDAIHHIMVGKRQNSEADENCTKIRKVVSEILKLPSAVFNMIQETRRGFCNFVKGFVEVQQHHGLNLSSFLLSFLINLNTSKEKDHVTLSLSSKKMSILCTVLVSNSYKLCLKRQWKDDIEKIRQTFKALQSSDEVENDILIKELLDNDKVLILDNEVSNVKFVSDDVRHKVMSYFVLNCLNTDEDYKNYINLTSVDSLLEYVCTWNQQNVEEERCIYIPEEMEDEYIKKLDINILGHVNMGDIRVRKEDLAKKLNIPQEVLDWDYDARCRYLEYAKKGTQKIHRARAMIVGCAGAGKTTLLKRLQHYGIQELKQIKSTVGLEVHENLFQIDNSSLKGLPEEEDTENKCLLSVVDFAGQSAYYACHQVYLSRRAFYLLVIDLSKQFGQKVDRTLCEKEGTMFSDWTYGQYIIFWLKSIHTYCDDDTPVITIATHCEQIPNKGPEHVYDELLELLQDEPDLKKHLDRSRCFHVGFPQNDNEPLDTLSDLEECIVNIALEDRWKETVPIDWAFCEEIFRKNKHKGRKIISITDFNKQVSIKKKGKDKETSDVLRFYHDIGTILYFNEDDLKGNIIIDIQWFVDCFKHIITDPMHVRDLAEYDREWRHFYESGYLSYRFLKRVWKKYKMDIRKCTPTLKYMQRLGLIAAGKTEHYVPSVNKLDFGENLKQYISSLKQSTSVLVFRFRFLPHFFYFRLVVACMVDGDWTVAEDDGQKQLFKNVVCFKFKDHLIVLAVNLTTIQAQVLRQGERQLSHEITKEIRFTIDTTLMRLTENFHKKTLYTTGYQCLKQNVLEENILCFLREDEIYGKGEITCPRHEMRNYHTVRERELLGYWKYDKEDQFAEKKDDLEMQKQRKDNVQDCMDAYQIGRDTLMRQGEKKSRQDVERSEQHTFSTIFNIGTITAPAGIVAMGNKDTTTVNQDNSASKD